MAQLPRTQKTLLTPEETTRVAASVKLLAASRGITNWKTLHDRVAAAGYPGSYPSLTRLMSASRPAQEAEVAALARYFNLEPRDLIGRGDPVKDAKPARLIEFDLPAVAGPSEVPDSVSELRTRRVRRDKGQKVTADDVLALTGAVAALTTVLRDLRDLLDAKPDQGLREVV